MIITFTRGAEDNVIWLQMSQRAAPPLWQVIADGIKSLEDDPMVERAHTFGSKASTQFFLTFHEPVSKSTVERVSANLVAYIDSNRRPKGTVAMDLSGVGEPGDEGPRRRTPVWSVDIDQAAGEAQPSRTRRQRERRSVSAILVDGLDAAIAKGEITYKQAWEAMKASLNGTDHEATRGGGGESASADPTGGET